MSQSLTHPVMIILTGGRSTPAILGVLAVQPRAVELINSRDEPYRQDEVLSALRLLADVTLPVTSETIDAHNMDEAFAACARIVQRVGSGPFVVNLSSGTKVMALGAYEFARQHKIPALYVDTNSRRVIDLTTNRSFPTVPLTVESYLACFRRSPVVRFSTDGLSCSFERAIELAEWFVSTGEPAFSVLERIRRHGEGKGKRSCTIVKYEPSDAERLVWKKLVLMDLLERVDEQNGRFSFTLRADADFEFLKGIWLEVFVWNEARNQRTKEGSPVFDDALFSFEIPADVSGACKQIDVGLMAAGQMIHCSCKSGSTGIWSTEHLDELRAVSSLVGGRFCSRVFVTSKVPPKQDESGWKDYQHFLEQAEDRQIVVITGDNLAQVGAILAKEAQNPTYRRI